MGPIGYGRPRPTYDLLEETDLLVFVGTVPDGFEIELVATVQAGD
ncbi:hypothetical protein ACVWY0_000850 [Arthrobacter sp. UYNi723]